MITMQIQLREGSMIGGRYQVEKVLRSQNTEVIYLCKDLSSGKALISVKVANIQGIDTRTKSVLASNLSFLNGLNHPNIAKLINYGINEDSGDLFMVEEWFNGEDLYSDTKGFEPEKVLGVLAELSQALHFLHIRGIVHGSINASNTILWNAGNKLIPKILSVVSPRHSNVMHQDGRSGDLAYLAPEILMGEAVNEQSDLYSLGVLIYQLLTRRLPFEDEDHGFMVQKYLQGRVDLHPVEHLRFGGGLSTLICGLLDKDPTRRPSSGEVMAALSHEMPHSYVFISTNGLGSHFSSSRLFGRDHEMQLIQECAGRVRNTKRGWTVFITGEAGSGKTRFLEEVKGWAILEQWRIVESDCGISEKGVYEPFRQILEKIEPNNMDGSFEFKDLPKLSEQSQFDVSLESAAGRFRDQLARELVRRLKKKPTLLLLHRLHLSDEALCTVLDYLSSDIQAHPILVCVSLRSTEESNANIARLMEMITREGRGQIVNMPPLQKKDVYQLVRGITGDSQSQSVLGEWLFDRIGGNPFFIEEMMKHLLEQGILSHKAGKWLLKTHELPQIDIPAGIGAVLRRRFAQLPRKTRDLANWLALFRRAIPKRFVRSVTAWDEDAINHSLIELSKRQMIRIDKDSPEESVVYSHSLIAEVLRAELPKKQQRRMHSVIAKVMESENDSSGCIQELARHYIASGVSMAGVEYALKAADECKKEFSDEAALQFYEYILRKRISLSPAVLHRTVIGAAESCCAIGTPKRAVALLTRHLRRFKRIKCYTKAQLLLKLTIAYHHMGDYSKLESSANDALWILKRAKGAEEQALRAEILTHLAYCQLLKSKPRRGLQLVQSALATNCKRDNKSAGQAYSLISALRRVACDLASAVVAGKESISILEPLRDLHMLAVAHSHLGACFVALGKYRKALEQHKRAVEVSELTRSLPLRSQALSNLAECLCRQGRLFEARSASEEAVRLSIKCGNPIIRHSALATLAEIRISTGDHTSAEEILSDLNSDLDCSCAIYSKAHVCYLLACLHYEKGEYDQALIHIESVRGYENKEAPIYERELAESLKALIWYERGRRSDAIQMLMKHLKRVSSKHWHYHRALLALYVGQCLLRDEDWLGARRMLRNAIRLAKGMNSSLLEANAHLLMGCVYSKWARGNADILLSNAKPELEAAIKMGGICGATEIIWRGHNELSRVEELMSNWESSLSHNSEAIKILKEASCQKSTIRLGCGGSVIDREQALEDCENRKNYISTRKKVFPDEEIQDYQMRTLLRVSSIINSIRFLDPLLEAIVGQLIKTIGVERALIFLKNESNEEYELRKYSEVEHESECRKSKIRLDIIEIVTKHECPFVSADAKRDPRISSDRASVHESGIVLCAPLKNSGRILGILYADHRMPAYSLSESVINLFAAFCHLSAIAIDNALAHQQLLREKSELEQYLSHNRDGYKEIIGKSAAVEAMRDRIGLAADSPLDVLIIGESGTGKELVARAIHRTGRRKSNSFIPIDCGSLSDSLVEAELFGYRKGAFTGASENRPGLFESADGGTIFLDEISNLPFRLQSKLLRVLQEREIRRLGETTPRRIDVQVLAATNKDLHEEMRLGRFRGDLYYRLKAMEIRVPSLRDRFEDIPLLLHYYLEKIAQTEQGRYKKLSPKAKILLDRYHYPGNIRELKNIIAQAYYSAKGAIIDADQLPTEIYQEGHELRQSDVATHLYNEILIGRGTYEELVRKPFLRREVDVNVVRGVMQNALKDTGGKYRDAFRRLRISDKRYSVILQFLKRNNCFVDFRPFRQTRDE